jgi:hypothetical protein
MISDVSRVCITEFQQNIWSNFRWPTSLASLAATFYGTASLMWLLTLIEQLRESCYRNTVIKDKPCNIMYRIIYTYTADYDRCNTVY